MHARAHCGASLSNTFHPTLASSIYSSAALYYTARPRSSNCARVYGRPAETVCDRIKINTAYRMHYTMPRGLWCVSKNLTVLWIAIANFESHILETSCCVSIIKSICDRSFSFSMFARVLEWVAGGCSCLQRCPVLSCDTFLH